MDMIEPGTHVKFWGEHSSTPVPCTDESCPYDHYVRDPARVGLEPNVVETEPSGVQLWVPGENDEPGQTVDAPPVKRYLVRYHRESERSAVDAIVKAVEPAAEVAIVSWVETNLTDELVRDYVETNNMPVRRRDDGTWMAMVVEKTVPAPWGEPKYLIEVKGGTELSVDVADVEVAT